MFVNKIFSKIITAIILLFSNPSVFAKKTLHNLALLPTTPFIRKINGVSFEFDFSIDPVLPDMYFGLYEPVIVKNMERFLKKGDVFVDIGANIGYMSARGAGFVGKTGEVHSFEPVPMFFNRLKRMSEMNPEHKIFVNNVALGEKEDITEIDITSKRNIGYNTMVKGYMHEEVKGKKAQVKVMRFDNYVKGKGLKRIALIKIDTEGYEFPVLKGMNSYLQSNEEKPVIIVEIAPRAYPLLGTSITELLDYMRKFSYHVYSLENTDVEIDITNLETFTNVIFIPGK